MHKKVLLIVALLAVAAVFFAFRESLTRENLEISLRQVGPWGPAVFILIYLVAPTLLIPATFLTVGAGVLFGPVWGTVYSIVGATGGATIAFLVSRYFGRDWVERRVSGRLKSVKEGVEEEGWKFLAFTRLVPIFPFIFLNYAFGLTRIPLVHFIVVSFISMLPATAVYVYLGYAGREAAAGEGDAVTKVLIAVGLLILISLIPKLVKKVKGAGASRQFD